MDSEKILQADMLDIVFEHRNKTYGAYALRKNYNSRLYKALGLVFLLVSALCLLSFVKKETKVSTRRYIITDGPTVAPPPKKDPPVTPPKTPPAMKTPQVKIPAVAQTSFTKPVITNDPVTDKIPTLDSTAIGTKTIKVPGGTPAVFVVTPAEPPAVPVPPAPEPIIDRNKATAFAEVMPAFPGGAEALRRYLQKNLVNPADMDAGEAITVKIRFVVGYDGVLKSFETIQDGGTEFNNEVVRVLKKMPQWTPGKTKGENVSVYYTLPVKFTSAE